MHAPEPAAPSGVARNTSPPQDLRHAMASTSDFVRLHSAALRALNDARHSPQSDRDESVAEALSAVDRFLELWNRSDTHPVPPAAGEAMRDAREALTEANASEAWDVLLDIGRSLDEYFRR